MSLTIDELADKGRRHKELALEISTLESERKQLGDEIIAELKRRTRRSVDAPGITMTRTSRRVGYKLEILKDRLRPAVFKRSTRLVPDGEQLKKELKAGTITEADLEAAEVRGAEFITITFTDAA